MLKNRKKVLFFIKGTQPTKEELEAADKLGTEMFRSAMHAGPTDPVESCDAVAGAVPERYLKLPRVDAPKVEAKTEETGGKGKGKKAEPPPVVPLAGIAQPNPTPQPQGSDTPWAK